MGDLIQRTTEALVPYESREIRSLRRQGTYVRARQDEDALLRANRIDNGFRLGHHTARKIAALNTENTSLSHDNPALELTLRALEQVLALGAVDLIADYMSPL
jgi:hypothetical protein